MEIKAQLKHLRIAPRKVRLVLGLIRGLEVIEAENQLKIMSKRASAPVLKLLNSAVANAKNNKNIDKENLFIERIFADEGSTLKRWLPRAFGKATPINKRASHITLILKQIDEKKRKKEKSELTTDKKVDKKDAAKINTKTVSQSRKDDREKRRPVAKAIDGKPQRQPSTVKKVFRRKMI